MAGETEGGSGTNLEGRSPKRDEDNRPTVPEGEQPVEHREGEEGFRAEEVVGFVDRQFQERQRRLKELDDYIAVHPRVQQQFREDPEQYLAALKKIQDDLGMGSDLLETLARRGAERGTGEDPHRIGEGTPRETRPGWQSIQVRSQLGLRPVWMPRTDEGKRYYVSEVLARIEATSEAEGGFTDKLTLEETALAITAIIENPEKYSQDKNLGQELKKFFLARLKLHGVYQQFSKASTAKDVVQILSAITAEEANTLFKEIEPARKAFLLYEKYSDEFLGAEVKREEIRVRIASETAEEKPSDTPGLQDIDPKWAQRIAERLWEISGRRAERDRLISKDPSISLKEAYKKKGGVDFLGGSANTGNFYVRRALQFKKWVRQTGEVFNPFFQLMNGWDLGSKDLLTKLVESTEDRLKREEYAKLRINNGAGEVSPQQKKDADQRAENETRAIFGGLSKDQPNDKNEQNQRWPILANWREDDEEGESKTQEPYADYLQRVDWTRVDFSAIGAYPFLEWALYNIGYPDAAKETLIGENKKFLQNPTYESLKETENAFAYMAGRSNHCREALFTNYINFAGMDYQEKLGKRNLTKIELDRQIGSAVVDKFISPEKSKELRDELFELRIPGRKTPIRGAWLREVKTFLYSISWLGGLWGFVKEFFKSAFSIK